MPRITLTARVVVDRFLDDLRSLVRSGEAKQGTYDYYEHQLSKLRPLLPVTLAAHAIKPHHLSRGPRTWHFHQASRRAFTWAFKVGLLKTDPLHGHQLPPAGRRERIPTEEEREAILRVCLPYLREFLVVLWDSGARPGELRDLRWRDLDLTPDLATAAIVDYKAKKRIKNAPPVRVLYFGEIVTETLRRWQRERQAAALDHVFRNLGGQPITSNALRIAFRKAATRAGIDPQRERLVPYSFRHGRATELMVSGMPAKLVSEFLGHRQMRTTERYLHPVKADVIQSLRSVSGKKQAAQRAA